MEHLRTVEEVCRREGINTIYCLAAMPGWEHYDPEHLPEPIVAWGREHCPNATIERLSGFGEEYVLQGDDAEELLSTLHLGPVFRLGFTPEQAQLFRQHWQAEQTASPSDFYFFVCSVGNVTEAEKAALSGELFVSTRMV